MSTRIDIGVVSYLAPEKLRRTLTTILQWSRREFRLLVVHNPSTHPDDAAAREVLSCFAAADSRVVPIWMETNVGYAGGVAELQRRLISEPGWGHLIYCDNDVIVNTDGWDKTLCDYLDRYPEIGMIFPNSGLYPIQREHYTEVMWGIGFCFATTRKVVTEVGLFDETLGHQEEADYALRVRMAGYVCAAVPQVSVSHDATASNDPASRERINAGIVRFVDKWCVYGLARVMLSKSRASLSSLVTHKAQVFVRSLHKDQLVDRKIVGWHRNQRSGRQMVHVSYEGAPGMSCRRGSGGVWVTEDHPVLTEEGWKQAGHLTTSDKLITAEPAPSSSQLAVIVGTLLGDGSIQKAYAGRPGLYLVQCRAQRAWLMTKCVALSGFEFSLGTRYTQLPSSKNVFAIETAKFKSCAVWANLERQFYKKDESGRRCKIVPLNLVQHVLQENPALFLVTWYLDDGTRAKRRYTKTDGTPGSEQSYARIATHGFTQAEVESLACLLTENGYESAAYKVYLWYGGAKRTYWELRFSPSGTRVLYQLISRFVIPELRMKVPDTGERFDEQAWSIGPSTRYCAPAVVSKQPRRFPNTVFCLDIEETHNFIVNNVVLHNCRYFNGKKFGYHSPNVTRWEDWPPNALYLEEIYQRELPGLNDNPETIGAAGRACDLIRVPRLSGFYRGRVI